ncbi:ATP-dependent sacrificial sulfur transferase LarE [Lentisphaerota bacterium WC36G]|nr:ATP-dependent sacrificial sulfur transferase LarE [Lentisphaerae bacterium WC36]
MDLENKKAELTNYLQSLKAIVIGCSGGIDSILLATVALEALGTDNVLLIHVRSDFSIESETNNFLKLVQSLHCHYKVVEINDILENQKIVKNSPERCYFCKHKIMSILQDEAKKASIKFVVDGTNLDDFDDYRPGLKATKQLEIIHPFVMANFNKDDIRQLAREFQLDVANLPSNSCLATRIPYYVILRKEILTMTGEAEKFLHSLGVYNCRVRYFDGSANISVDASSMKVIFKNHGKVCSFLKSLGYDDVALNLSEYKTGDLNRNLQ